MSPLCLSTPPTILGWLPILWQQVLFANPSTACQRLRLSSLAILLFLPAALLYPTLGFRLLEPDEGRYAQIPKEMLTNREWVVPTLQGEAYLDKPPLMYWLVKLSYMAFGVSEASARLIPALCVHLTILTVYVIGRRSLGERAAFWAALLLTVAPGFIGIARLLLLDGLLTLCVTVSLMCGYEAVRQGQLKRGWWLAAAVASGLGFLTKGPISEILLFPPLVAAAWLSGTLAKIHFKMMMLFASVIFSMNVPWYVAIYCREPEFLKYFFWDHNLMRFLQPFDHLQPVWYYSPILFLGLMPGTLFFVPYFRRLFGASNSVRPFTAAGGFWLLAGGWCVVFFSVSGSKLPTYILPAYPFLCLALGELVASADSRLRKWAAMTIAAMALFLFNVFHLGMPWYAEMRSPFGQPAIVNPYLEREVPVITYPRNCDSLAFYSDRADFERVRSKGVNELMVAMHHRPRTVILFTHRHSFEAFREAMPASLMVAEHVSLARRSSGIFAKLTGETPWGLADIAVIAPVTPRAQDAGSK